MIHQEILSFIRQTFGTSEFIPLHAPYFGGNERKYVMDTIDSTFVSSVGAYVTKFEEMICDVTKAKFAIATVNGTTALHLALVLAGVEHGDEVITQPLTFVATANAIRHANGSPVFVDVDRDTLGLSPEALREYLNKHAEIRGGRCFNKVTGQRIAAVVPMHTFGFPARIQQIADVCKEYNIPLVEDAAESLGSYYNDRHTGTFGLLGTFSFNGNKTITCGGGGAIITDDESLARRAKHISTTAKKAHPWEFFHDELGYNYRLPNLNAALACAQFEQLDDILANKQELSDKYRDFFQGTDVSFVTPIPEAKANNWLNTIIFKDHADQQAFLKDSNEQRVMTRPIWQLMQKLPMYQNCQTGDLNNAVWLEERVVNIPSGYRIIK